MLLFPMQNDQSLIILLLGTEAEGQPVGKVLAAQAQGPDF